MGVEMVQLDPEKVREDVKRVFERYNRNPARMIEILQDLQDIYHWLPKEVLKEVSRQTEVPLSRIYHMATFFKAFSLKPRGRYVIQVCTGTTCHVKGAYMVLDRLKSVLGIEVGETTPDLTFTLETVNCVGACAIAPVVVINDRYYGYVTPSKVEEIVREYREAR